MTRLRTGGVMGRAGGRRGLDRLGEADWEALLIWLATRLGVIVLGTVGAAMLAQGETVAPFLDRLRRWDADHLVEIARYGYAGDPAQPPDAGLPAFFPGMPLALRAVHMILPDWVLGGVVISLIAGCVAMVALSRLGELEGPPGAGRWAVLAVLFWPTSVFLFAGYSEALFLAFAIPAWLAARRGRWPAACLLAAGASCVRITGLFLACALIVEYAAGRRRAVVAERAGAVRVRVGAAPEGAAGAVPADAGAGAGASVQAGVQADAPVEPARARWWSARMAWLAVPFVPLVLYSAYQYARTGDWLAWKHAQEAGWGRTLVWPWESFLTTWQQAMADGRFAWAFRMELAGAAVGVVAIVWLLALRRWSELIYVGLQVGALLCSAYYLSIPRSTLLWWPLWIVIGQTVARRPWMMIVYGALTVPLMVLNTMVFLEGSWAG
ncbi:mannosyltransferase family protein [Thermopolyspora sp. NPDC052614]|uniref:mannosyltransferase family protein n=1 Tax=Thermopolyspora sp. NPDC052614 TaxID=3155682 RepID=UPI003424CC90